MKEKMPTIKSTKAQKTRLKNTLRENSTKKVKLLLLKKPDDAVNREVRKKVAIIKDTIESFLKKSYSGKTDRSDRTDSR